MSINKKEIAAGFLMLLIGVAALLIVSDYNIGSARRMGPGYFPLILSGLLSLVGVLIIVTGVKSDAKSLPNVSWRPMLVIFISLIGFMLGMYLGGLLPAIVLTIAISSLADKKSTWKDVLLLAGLVPLAAWLIFNQALSLPIPFLEWRF
tara:strand:- start:88 stop:534 length:447 start_codon:yes stop_codon:yes gene_type:complete